MCPIEEECATIPELPLQIKRMRSPRWSRELLNSWHAGPIQSRRAFREVHRALPMSTPTLWRTQPQPSTLNPKSLTSRVCAEAQSGSFEKACSQTQLVVLQYAGGSTSLGEVKIWQVEVCGTMPRFRIATQGLSYCLRAQDFCLVFLIGARRCPLTVDSLHCKSETAYTRIDIPGIHPHTKRHQRKPKATAYSFVVTQPRNPTPSNQPYNQPYKP